MFMCVCMHVLCYVSMFICRNQCYVNMYYLSSCMHACIYENMCEHSCV